MSRPNRLPPAPKHQITRQECPFDTDHLGKTSDITPGAARDAVREAFVAVVQTGEDTHSRRVYLSLKPAERVARRARERGDAAAVVVCELVPVHVLGGAS